MPEMIQPWLDWLAGDGRGTVFLALMGLLFAGLLAARLGALRPRSEGPLWLPARPAPEGGDPDHAAAAALLAAGRSLEAMQLYRAIVDRAPADADALYNLGHAYFALRQYGPARACWRAVRRLQPERADARTNLRLAAKLMRASEFAAS